MRNKSSEYYDCGMHKMCDKCHQRFASMKQCPLCTKCNQRVIEKVIAIVNGLEIDDGKELHV